MAIEYYSNYEDVPERLRHKYIKRYQQTNFDFALTSYCQAKCRSCARMDQNQNPYGPGVISPYLKLQHFDLDIFTKIVSKSELIKHTNQYIQFCGELGDPMMHPQIEDFIEVALTYGGGCHINTNGGLRKPKWYEHIVKKFDTGPHDRRYLSMKFGIDGTDQETSNMYRDGVDLNRAMDNMTAFFEAGGEGEWHFLIFDWNYHQIFEAYEKARKIKGCEIYYKFNNRTFGEIQPDNKKTAMAMLDEIRDKDDGNVCGGISR